MKIKLLLCIVISLCMLTACGSQSADFEKLAQKSWDAVENDEDIYYILAMKYTSRQDMQLKQKILF